MSINIRKSTIQYNIEYQGFYIPVVSLNAFLKVRFWGSFSIIFARSLFFFSYWLVIFINKSYTLNQIKYHSSSSTTSCLFRRFPSWYDSWRASLNTSIELRTFLRNTIRLIWWISRKHLWNFRFPNVCFWSKPTWKSIYN